MFQGSCFKTLKHRTLCVCMRSLSCSSQASKQLRVLLIPGRFFSKVSNTDGHACKNNMHAMMTTSFGETGLPGQLFGELLMTTRGTYKKEKKKRKKGMYSWRHYRAYWLTDLMFND